MAAPTKQRWTLTVDLDGERLSWAEETELIRAIQALPRVLDVWLKREFADEPQSQSMHPLAAAPFAPTTAEKYPAP